MHRVRMKFFTLALPSQRTPLLFLAAYMACPCHVEMILSEKAAVVSKEADSNVAPRKASRKQLAMMRLKQ